MVNEWLNVGKIVNTHGIRGELKIVSSTDFANDRFAVGNTLSILHGTTGQRHHVEIERAREHKGMYIILFRGYSNINEVEHYKGSTLQVAIDELDRLNDGEYYHYQIIGCEVVTDEGEVLGMVTEILSPGANDVWTVKGKVQSADGKTKMREVLIPVIDEVVLEVDVQAKRIRVHLMEGLI